MIRCAAASGGLSYTVVVFFGGAALGAAFLALLLWLFYLAALALRRFQRSPEQRAKQKSLQKNWGAHPFFRVCSRARAAYIILCLEEALRFTGQQLSRWEWVRRELWSVTELSEDYWFSRVCDLMPDVIFSEPSYDELTAARCGETARLGYAYSEAEYRALYALYMDAGDAMEPISFLMEQLLELVMADLEEEKIPYMPQSLRFVEEAQACLRTRGIPLPQNQTAVAYLMKRRHPGDGPPFRPFFLP